MTICENPVELANNAAARAARAWLLTVGLATETDAVRFPDGFNPVPAPGLDGHVATAERASATAALCADRAAALSADLAASDAAGSASHEAFVAAANAERVARRMAQFALGVSSHVTGDDRIERLDRAAVAVLHPPAGSGRTVGLVEDGMVLVSRIRPEFVVELGGAICRLLIDRDARLVFAAQSAVRVELSVNGVDTLCVATQGAEVNQEDGWAPDDAGGWVAHWPPPVTVRETAEAVAAVLLARWNPGEEDICLEVYPSVVHSPG